MGASQSTRKITLISDDKEGVIKLTDSMARRLRDQIESQQKPIPAKPHKEACSECTTDDRSTPISVVDFDKKTSAAKPETAVPFEKEAPIEEYSTVQKKQPVDSLSWFNDDAHIFVAKLKEEKEREIQNTEEKWKLKLQEREREFTETAQLTEKHFSMAVKSAESMFLKASCTPVCQEHQESVMRCYQNNSKQSLRCAREVEEFTRCVDLSRLQSLMREGTT